jgi:hypothetical protein
VGLKSLKSLNLTNVYPNNNNNNKKSNKVKCKPLDLYELAGKNISHSVFRGLEIKIAKIKTKYKHFSSLYLVLFTFCYLFVSGG